MHTTGNLNPCDFLRKNGALRDGLGSGHRGGASSGGLRRPLCTAAAAASQIDSLSSARSITARVLTEAKSAQSHVHIGNTELSL
jgi:hypothetical protein